MKSVVAYILEYQARNHTFPNDVVSDLDIDYWNLFDVCDLRFGV